MIALNNLQRVIEEENLKDKFKKSLIQLTEKYDIKGNVFSLDVMERPVEIVEGYLVEEKTFDSLDECMKEFKIGQAISINEGKFTLGTPKKLLGECDKTKRILDIEYLKYIE